MTMIVRAPNLSLIVPAFMENPGIGEIENHVKERDVGDDEPDRFGLEQQDGDGQAPGRQNGTGEDEQFEMAREPFKGGDGARLILFPDKRDVRNEEEGENGY